jgi:hypothetical protein
MTAAQSTVVPQTDSLAAAVLAVLPAVYGVSLLLPVAGYAWNPVEYAVSGFAFYLAGVVLAAFDEYQLRRAGVEGASAYWALLTAMPYLVARTRVLVNEDRAGLSLLWVAIGTSLAAIAGLALIALV